MSTPPFGAVVGLRWVEVDPAQAEGEDGHGSLVCVARAYYGTTSHFKLQAQFLTEHGARWLDVPIEWKP